MYVPCSELSHEKLLKILSRVFELLRRVYSTLFSSTRESHFCAQQVLRHSEEEGKESDDVYYNFVVTKAAIVTGLHKSLFLPPPSTSSHVPPAGTMPFFYTLLTCLFSSHYCLLHAVETRMPQNFDWRTLRHIFQQVQRHQQATDDNENDDYEEWEEEDEDAEEAENEE